MRISKIQNQNDYLHKFTSYLNLFIQINIKFTVDNKNAKKAVELVNLLQNYEYNIISYVHDKVNSGGFNLKTSKSSHISMAISLNPKVSLV